MKTDGRLFWVRATWFLDRLRQGRGSTANDLAERFCYHTQSARRTIAALRDDFGAPLEWDPRRSTWVLRDPHWELPRLMLSPGELTALSLARSLVSHVTAPGIAADMDRFWSKFSLELAAQSPAGAAFADSVSALAPTWAEPDPHVMEVCLRGLALERRLRLRYQSPWSATQTDRTVEPRHLLLYEGGFYLAAHCLLRHGDLRLFHLSAIRDATLTDAPVTPARFSLDQVVDAYGLMLGGDPVDVTLRISPPTAARAAVETWHRDQRDERAPDGTLTRTFPVRGLAEVQRLVLSLGAAVQVLAPAALRDRVRDEVARMARHYRDGEDT